MTRKSISVRVLAVTLCIILALSLLPILRIAFYNHPYYDDYGYTVLPHAVWQQTGNVWLTLREAIQNVINTRATWEANYSATFPPSFQATVFNENAYWTCTFLILGALLSALACFLRLCCVRLLKASGEVTVCLFAMISLVSVQFMPCVKEALFWNTGGMAYTFLWAMMLLRLCCTARMMDSEKAAGIIGWGLLSLLLTFITGGSKFTTGLTALLVEGIIVIWRFCTRHPRKWMRLGYALLLLVLFISCVFGEGNQVRAATLQGSPGFIKTVIECFYFGTGLIGDFFSLPVLCMWLTTLLLIPALRRSAFRFRMPLLVTAIAFCLFCAQLAPTIYTGLYLGDGRVINSYYYTYLLLTSVLAVYWMGWAVHRFDFGSKPANSERSVSLRVLCAVCAVFVIGCTAYHPDGTESYGLQNTAGGSSLRLLLNGDAEAFDKAMDERYMMLTDPDVTDVKLRAVTEHVPLVFMGDCIDIDNQAYVLSLFEEYYGKNSVTMEGGNQP